MKRKAMFFPAALGLCLAAQARAQQVPESRPLSGDEMPASNLQDRPVEPPPPQAASANDAIKERERVSFELIFIGYFRRTQRFHAEPSCRSLSLCRSMVECAPAGLSATGRLE